MEELRTIQDPVSKYYRVFQYAQFLHKNDKYTDEISEVWNSFKLAVIALRSSLKKWFCQDCGYDLSVPFLGLIQTTRLTSTSDGTGDVLKMKMLRLQDRIFLHRALIKS